MKMLDYRRNNISSWKVPIVITRSGTCSLTDYKLIALYRVVDSAGFYSSSKSDEKSPCATFHRNT